MAGIFRPRDVDPMGLFPPGLSDFLPEGHPAMMTALLPYGSSRGVYSSRKLEAACIERVDFMAVTAMGKPDHMRIGEFRRRHLTGT